MRPPIATCLLLLAAFAAHAATAANEIAIDAARLRQSVQANFPYSVDALGGLFAVTARDPQLDIPAQGNRLKMQFHASVASAGDVGALAIGAALGTVAVIVRQEIVLAIMPVVMVGSALGIFAYVQGNAVFSRYLLLPFIPGAGELLIFCSAMAGAGLAFLWFNTHPAQVFMGDVGALALGAALGTIAVIVRQEIVLAIMGGIFVVEALSVMAQVLWFKYTRRRYGAGRRLLKMAPLHHHFEKSGWKETQVVVRFWIITMLLCLMGLSTLKLR